MSDKTRFFIKFLRSPNTVGSVWPSSPKLCQAMISGINIDKLGSIIELGAGTGVITSCIARSAKENTKVVIVELDRRLAAEIRQNMPRVKVVNDSAANLKEILNNNNIPSAGAIVSGLPWAIFSHKLQNDILDAIVENLAPDGFFTTFAYLQGLYLPAGRRFKKQLKKRFNLVETSPIIWRNLPPAFVYRCSKAK